MLKDPLPQTNPRSLEGKSILLGVTGSIAVSKVPEICQQLINRGATIRMILTESAKKLLSEGEFENLNQLLCNQIYQDLFEKDNQMSHINLTRISDLFLIAPITAQSIQRIANARADDLLSATVLASNQKIMLAPAMNREMYQNQNFQANLAKLKTNPQFIVLDPDVGRLACNEYGVGRLINSEVLIEKIENYFNQKTLIGKKALITVGASVEHIDPVRYISNFSSGKMGFAIAEALMELGAEVTLIEGKVEVNTPKNAKVVSSKSADQMLNNCITEIKNLANKKDQPDSQANLTNPTNQGKTFDYFFAAAAVSDYKVQSVASQKIKKNAKTLNLQLVKNKDILKTISNLKKNRPKVVIGFAAETENLIVNASKKLEKKNLDFICANLVSDDKAFGKDNNELVVIKKEQPKNTIRELKLNDKRILAQQVVDLVIQSEQSNSTNSKI